MSTIDISSETTNQVPQTGTVVFRDVRTCSPDCRMVRERTRLPNGNIVVGTSISKRIIEMNGSGKVLHIGQQAGYICRVRAR